MPGTLECILNYAPQTLNKHPFIHSLYGNILAVDLIPKKRSTHVVFKASHLPLVSNTIFHDKARTSISFIKSDIALESMLDPNVRCVV